SGDIVAAIHITAGDGLRIRLWNDGHRIDQARSSTVGRRVKTLIAFPQPPAVITAEGNAINFFQTILPHIRQPDLTRVRIKAPPPGIAQTPGKDFGTAGIRSVGAIEVVT